MIDLGEIYLAKADESLAGAESEFANGRYSNCANRSYYACFQAAITALLRAEVHPSGDQSEWGHAFVQARFAGELINRRKLYAAELRDALVRCYALRQTADYSTDPTTEVQAARALRRARAVVDAIARGGERR